MFPRVVYLDDLLVHTTDFESALVILCEVKKSKPPAEPACVCTCRCVICSGERLRSWAM